MFFFGLQKYKFCEKQKKETIRLPLQVVSDICSCKWNTTKDIDKKPNGQPIYKWVKMDFSMFGHSDIFAL